MAAVIDKRGLRDWIVQRLSAVVIGIYTIFVLLFLLAHPNVTYGEWHGLFSNFLMRLITLFVMLCIIWHAWIGLWTVLTDYVKPKLVRVILELLILLALWGGFVWVVESLWA